MPANRVSFGPTICPQCESLMIKDYCANCGYTLDSVESEETVVSQGKSFIFDSKNRNSKQKSTSKKEILKKIFVIFLFITIFGGISGYGYWLYQSTTVNFLSPANDFIIKKANEGVIADVNNSKDESLIDYDIKLKEGNFKQYNFAQFIVPEASIYMQMFGTFDFLKKFYTEDVTKKYLKDLDLMEDDLNVYLSSGFVISLPDDNFDRWGYATAVVDKKYVESKIALLENLREKKKDKAYQNLFAKIVTIKEKPLEIVESSDVDDTKKVEEKEQIYLLVSNSKEYLDQMKEVSEGVLPNLYTSAIFAQAQKSLPAVGNVLIYRNKKVDFYNEFYAWFASKFQYEGLDKILGKVESSMLVLYSQNAKLKISGISEL